MNLDPTFFALHMRLTATLTQSEMPSATLLAYEPRFKSWSKSEFEEAMAKCGDELNRFPTVGQIRARRPKSHRTATEVIEYGNLLAIGESADKRGPDELEQQIDNLTDEELQALFRWYAPFDGDRDMNEDQIIRACEWLTKRFRRSPNSAVYRGYVRDGLLKMKQRAA